MRTELISIPTDSVPLDGAYFEPDDGPVAGAVIFFHGNTMNFYVGAPRFMPPALTGLGFACLSFNRRGHDILSVRDSKENIEGAAFQTTAEALADHEFAAAWLADRGFASPVVIAHSNGGMMSPPYVLDHPGTPALVLLSAGHGGPARSQRLGLLAGGDVEEVQQQALALVAAGKGRELMRVPGWWYLITAESFLDRIETVPDLLAAAPKISCPVLYIRGDQESAESFPGEEYQRLAGGTCELQVVPDCDHFYTGREDIITGLVCDFLSRVTAHER
jgi:pimeloyl-ACP methyl ester carboxylesterase